MSSARITAGGERGERGAGRGEGGRQHAAGREGRENGGCCIPAPPAVPAEEGLKGAWLEGPEGTQS